jgi:hypothetical protein
MSSNIDLYAQAKEEDANHLIRIIQWKYLYRNKINEWLVTKDKELVVTGWRWHGTEMSSAAASVCHEFRGKNHELTFRHNYFGGWFGMYYEVTFFFKEKKS